MGTAPTEVGVLLGTKFLAARDRLGAGYAQSGTVTVQQFAEACSDIKITAPFMDSEDAIAAHFVHWWARLIPPPSMEKYHAAIMDFYLEWQRVGDFEQVDVRLEMAMMEAFKGLDGDVVETLLRERCSG